MKIKNMRFVLFLLLLFAHQGVSAQEYFARAESNVLPTIYSGSVMASTDLNKDGLDDLLLMDGGKHLKAFYQRGDGRGFYYQDLGAQSFKSKWSMVVGDIEGNGSSDVLLMGAYDDIQWVNVDGDNIREKLILAPELYAQGANLTDIDNDGFLDLFVCNDVAESYIYAYDPDRKRLVRTEDWLDMSTSEPSDNSGNYGSVWSDFDMNGLPDLYIAKCKAGVTDPTDPRRINTLFLQKSALEFEEVGIEYGLDDGSQSWTADFADVDNDGDWDCFIANHKGPSKLMIQVAPGVFEDQSESWGLNVRFNIIQAKFADIDNNGWVDLVLSGAGKGLYLNSGNSFRNVPFLDENALTSFVLGDWNNDGWLDLYASYCDLINIPSSVADRLWWNNGGNGDHIRLSLQGVFSNRDAVGARVELFSGQSRQMREVRAGESYGVQNSNIVHFGLPPGQEIDSMVIHWPSGHVDVINEPQVNKRYHAIEGECWYIPPDIIMDKEGYLCKNDSISLRSISGDQFLWNTGDTTDLILVDKAGPYQVTVSTAGCDQKSIPVYIRKEPDEDPIIESSNGQVLCEGAEMKLTSVEGSAYSWNTGESSREITVDAPGTYNVTITGFCRDTVSPDFIIEEIDSPDPPVIEGDSLVLPGFGATVKAIGEKILWYRNPSDGFPIGNGAWFTFDELFTDTTIYASVADDQAGETLSGGEPFHKGSSKFSANSLNGGIYFTVGVRCLLQSVKVFTDEPGERLFELVGPDGLVLAAKRLSLQSGENMILFNLELLPSSKPYLLTTNSQVNIELFGHQSPLLYRSDEEVEFPYLIGDEIVLTKSVFGTRYYYYFYDWKVQQIDGCESERVPATVKVLTADERFFEKGSGFLLFPNPSKGEVTLSWDQNELGASVEFSIFDLSGRMIKYGRIHNAEGQGTLQAELFPGIFMLRLTSKGKSYFERMVVH